MRKEGRRGACQAQGRGSPEGPGCRDERRVVRGVEAETRGEEPRAWPKPGVKARDHRFGEPEGGPASPNLHECRGVARPLRACPDLPRPPTTDAEATAGSPRDASRAGALWGGTVNWYIPLRAEPSDRGPHPAPPARGGPERQRHGGGARRRQGRAWETNGPEERSTGGPEPSCHQ